MTSLSVTVCRGCCCGDTDKHPDVDHRGQVEVLQQALEDSPEGKLWETDCLGPCERSNVIVVRSGAVRRWFGPVLSEGLTKTMAAWIADSGLADPPLELAEVAFEPHPDDEAGLTT